VKIYKFSMHLGIPASIFNVNVGKQSGATFQVLKTFLLANKVVNI